MDADVLANEFRNSKGDKGDEEMSKSQQVFEAMMVAKGYTDLTQVKGRYTSPAIQTRWNYFILGWQLRGVHE